MGRAIRVVYGPTRKGKTVHASVLVEFGERSDAEAILRFVQYYTNQQGHSILAQPQVQDITGKCRAFVKGVV